MKMATQLVVCAANRDKNGLIICGARHYDSIMIEQIKALGDSWGGKVDCEQGFIDNFGKFLSREEALEIALKNNQRRERCGGDAKILFSENLY